MQKKIVRDISWLSFNKRVLQEAADPTVPLMERIRFLGIFSNNLDEFFRVRVAALKRMIDLGSKARMHLEENPEKILSEILESVLKMQEEFQLIWNDIQKELKKESIQILDEKKLSVQQKTFVEQYFDEEVRGLIVPLMIESIKEFPVLNDKALYLACTLKKSDNSIPSKFALISIPVKSLSRFVILPSKKNEISILLLEDIIRFCLPKLFSHFGFDKFSAHAFKVTRDAEIDIDNDISTTIIQKIEKGIKNRKKGKPVRFVYDKEMPHEILTYLVKRMGLSHKDNLIAGGKIHNFKDFMNFPTHLIKRRKNRKKPFTHPELLNQQSVTKVVLEKDILLNFPYHSFSSLIDLLREAAIDPEVTKIKITCYRLAPKSKIINALINAARNGKQVTVVIELRARFDEEANLFWKNQLEEAGVKVLIGVPGMKVHGKICLIQKKHHNRIVQYGFVSTGNLNEKTAEIYGDHCLLTSEKNIISDIGKVFYFLEKPESRIHILKSCKTLLISPVNMRDRINKMIDREIRNAKHHKQASITLKLNSLSDRKLIDKLEQAVAAGVELNMIIRSICCMPTENKKKKKEIKCLSIVDEFLEHARVMIFQNHNEPKIFISSSDWMIRNIDHRIEIACPIMDKKIQQELIDILSIQLRDNIKARIINDEQNNIYVNPRNSKKIRSQIETYEYLLHKKSVPTG